MTNFEKVTIYDLKISFLFKIVMKYVGLSVIFFLLFSCVAHPWNYFPLVHRQAFN